jgi:hypothetical protein
MKLYLVRAKDRRTKEEFILGEYHTMEEAEKRRIEADDACDVIWCENHTHWIEEV